MIRAAALLAVAAVCAGGACASDDDARPAVVVDLPRTASLGSLPPVPTEREPLPTPPSLPPASTTTVPPRRPPITGPIGDEVLGDRVLLIGDTALAATTARQGGLACEVIPTFGWDVAVDAEPGRTLDFASEVLDRRLPEGVEPARAEDWDVVGFFFGNHLDRSPADFAAELDRLVERVSPRPVILYTVSGTEETQAQLNDAIRTLRRSRPNVVVVDWAGYTAAEPELLLADGGPVPTEEGSGRIVLFTVAALGDAPGGDVGECLPSPFEDDSAIVL